ncbi:MAG: hypothetical protein V7746_11085 [Halioglobus sp.]
MRTVLLHGHIFKNAGTSFDWSLERNFGTGFLDHRDDKSIRQRRGRHLKELLKADTELTVISSHHMCLPPANPEGVHFEKAYLLRHPIERIASVYAFEREQAADTPGARAAKVMDFTDYVSWRMEPKVARTIRDYQSFYLAGLPVDERRKPLSDASYQAALDNLNATACIGVVDRYDESMVVFEAALAQYFPDIDLAYIRQNASRKLWRREKNTAAKIDDVLSQLGELKDLVLANNSHDASLYQMANDKLDQAITNVTGFDQHLSDFQRRCKALRKSG